MRPLNLKIIYIFKFDVCEASSVRKPKSSNILPQKKNFVKSMMKQYSNPDLHAFFYLLNYYTSDMQNKYLFFKANQKTKFCLNILYSNINRLNF